MVGEVDDPTQSSHAAPGGDEGWDGPADGRCGGEASDGDADPDEGCDRAVGVGGAYDAEAECGAADEDGLADSVGVPSSADEGVD